MHNVYTHIYALLHLHIHIFFPNEENTSESLLYSNQNRCSYGSLAANAAQHVAKFCWLALLIVRPLSNSPCRRSGWPASGMKRCARSSVGWRTATSERSRIWRSTWGWPWLLCRRDRIWATAWTTESPQQLWRTDGEQGAAPQRTALRSSTPESGHH